MIRPLQAWNRYWFKPSPLFDLAVARIFFVTTQLAIVWLWDPVQEYVELSALPDEMYDPLPILHVLVAPLDWTFRPGVEMLQVVWWAVIAAGLTSIVGLFTNLSLAVFALGSVFLKAYAYSFGDFHHTEALMMIALVLLALSPAGRALSVDDLRRRLKRNHSGASLRLPLTEETSPFARWPLLTIQWLFALVYASSAVAKFRFGGSEWLNGHTLQWYMLKDALSRDAPVGVWLGQQHGLSVLLSWVTVLFEGTFFLVLLFPVLAWIYLPTGIALHTGIYVTMRAGFFQFIGLYAAFVPWSRFVTWVGDRREDRGGKKLEVYYDGLCPLCIRALTGVDYLAWLGGFTFVDLETREGRQFVEAHPELSLDDLRREMHVVEPDGTVRRGFFAFRRIAWRLPAVWPILPLMYLPFAGRAGPLIYRWVAEGRARVLRCDSAACETHAPAGVR